MIQKLVEYLSEKYNPSVIILYGSRADNTFTQTSDIDIVCFCKSCKVKKEARLFEGLFLDAWFYKTSEMNTENDEFIRLSNGICLLDTNNNGSEFLKKIQNRIELGPKKLDESDTEHLKKWVQKMILRSKVSDVEGNFRKMWLSVDLLEMYFKFRGLWYFGPKKALLWLQSNDPRAYKLFEVSYQTNATLTSITKLAKYVTSIQKTEKK
ncbi:MAG: nucleotidyltransferase domain-containing protein [Candidatus Riflebacteria bacterium]|nr:nucleotidyltransferase domain-containing protein [Candidatus Riflebacteria bacterium]